MKLTTYADAEAFLKRAQVDLESSEAANSVMFGVGGQLVQQPDWFCALFADPANATPNHIYQQIGYELMCD
jgi:hypothetical protein